MEPLFNTQAHACPVAPATRKRLCRGCRLVGRRLPLRGPLILMLALALLVPAAGVQAAAPQHTHMETREGRFLVGTSGAGETLFPEGVDAPDHERLPFQVNTCHRELELDLSYRPAGLTANTSLAEATLPYRFRVSLYAPNGTQLVRYVVEDPEQGLPLGKVDQAGNYTLQLELIEGANVHWEARVQGWRIFGEPTCDLWLNEVETNPAGADNGSEFVEVYNVGNQSFDLTGWSLRAKTPNETQTYPVPNGTSVPAADETSGGFATVDLEGASVPDSNATLELVPPVGGELDASPVLDDTRDDAGTHQRSPDGAEDWIFAEGTPGAPNPN